MQPMWALASDVNPIGRRFACIPPGTLLMGSPKSEEGKGQGEWNRAQADFPREFRVHQMFEFQAARTPDAVAVCFEDQSWTYGELNERANRVAVYLRDRGVGPEVMVG